MLLIIVVNSVLRAIAVFTWKKLFAVCVNVLSGLPGI